LYENPPKRQKPTLDFRKAASVPKNRFANKGMEVIEEG
jgi:hypothetical protein